MKFFQITNNNYYVHTSLFIRGHFFLVFIQRRNSRKITECLDGENLCMRWRKLKYQRVKFQVHLIGGTRVSSNLQHAFSFPKTSNYINLFILFCNNSDNFLPIKIMLHCNLRCSNQLNRPYMHTCIHTYNHILSDKAGLYVAT